MLNITIVKFRCYVLRCPKVSASEYYMVWVRILIVISMNLSFLAKGIGIRTYQVGLVSDAKLRSV